MGGGLEAINFVASAFTRPDSVEDACLCKEGSFRGEEDVATQEFAHNADVLSQMHIHGGGYA